MTPDPIYSDPILVTGAAGFCGSHLVQLLSASHDVVGWARSAPPADVAPLARWQSIDLCDRQAVRRAIAELRPSEIYHCAGLPHVGESWRDAAKPLAVNALGTHYLLDAVRRTDLDCRILVVGSATVYARSESRHTEDDPVVPDTPYSRSKLAAEQLGIRSAVDDGMTVIVTRTFNHTGPRQAPSFVAPSIARQIALIERGDAEPVIRIGNVDVERDLSDVRDVVRAYAALMKDGTAGAIYNVCSGVGRTVRSVMDALLARARATIRVEVDPSRFRPNDPPVFVGTGDRLRQATGWAPKIPFDQTLDDLLEYWRGAS